MTIILQPQDGPAGSNVPFLVEPNYSNGGMSFLQMVQRLRQESATSGSAPATVVNQTGDMKKLVDWISTAWMDIQNEKTDWFFMRQPIAFNTVPGQQVYTAEQCGIASFGNFKRDSFRFYRVSTGYGSELCLPFMLYDDFRDVHLFGSNRARIQLPLNFSLDPSKNFVIGPTPDDVYTVNGEGFAQPTELVLDTDRPTMPPQYHMAIVWLALQYYATSEAAPEMLGRGENNYNRLMNRLYKDQAPEIVQANALA